MVTLNKICQEYGCNNPKYGDRTQCKKHWNEFRKKLLDRPKYKFEDKK